MDIIQDFYDNMASQYDKLFYDWQTTVHEQAVMLNRIFNDNGFDTTAHILDCACGIGTQSIGLASLGYQVTASDISAGEISEARERTKKENVSIRFERADFRALEDCLTEQFDIVIAMDNALPHMLSSKDLDKGIKSITSKTKPNGIIVASIRGYDSLLETKPLYSPPYIHKTDKGKRVSFQTWDWENDNYHLVQYVIEDEKTLLISKFECEYRAVCREELTSLFRANGCIEVQWMMPEVTGFYQPIVIAKKR